MPHEVLKSQIPGKQGKGDWEILVYNGCLIGMKTSLGSQKCETDVINTFLLEMSSATQECCDFQDRYPRQNYTQKIKKVDQLLSLTSALKVKFDSYLA